MVLYELTNKVTGMVEFMGDVKGMFKFLEIEYTEENVKSLNKKIEDRTFEYEIRKTFID